MNEQDIIAAIGHVLGPSGQRLLSDDVYLDPTSRQILTTDMLVEFQHFDRAYFSPYDLGWKAAAVNISDIAATGGRLKSLLVSLALPSDIDIPWVEAFYQGLIAVTQPFGGKIVGGDTVASDRLTINVTAVGECPALTSPGHRYNAEAGDFIISTGYHGLSAVGLSCLRSGQPGFSLSRQAHLRPQPRMEAGEFLSHHYERYALMDTSDGLADAALKIAAASHVHLQLDATLIPLHQEVLAGSRHEDSDQWKATVWQNLLYGGEDFELLATVPYVDEHTLKHFRVIGRVLPLEPKTSASASLREKQTGKEIPLSMAQTYQHFSSMQDAGISLLENRPYD